MAPERPEILPEETRSAPPPAPDRRFVQPRPNTPVIPQEVWKKMSEEERKRFGDETWREQQ